MSHMDSTRVGLWEQLNTKTAGGIVRHYGRDEGVSVRAGSAPPSRFLRAKRGVGYL
jgi:hypothetical protein